MENYHEIKIKVPKEMDAKKARQELSRSVYQLAVHFYEGIGEGKKILAGNGHHMAQSLSKSALDIWDSHKALER